MTFKFSLGEIIPIVACVIVGIVYIAYKMLTRRLTEKEVKKYLKINLSAISSDFKNYLLDSSESNCNSLLKNYLNDNSESNLTSLASFLKSKQNCWRNGDFTLPGSVMDDLIKQIISEQLNTPPKQKFTFDEETYQNLEKTAPFVKKFCFIIKLDTNYEAVRFAAEHPTDLSFSFLDNTVCLVQNMKSKGADIQDFYYPDKIIMPFHKYVFGIYKYNFSGQRSLIINTDACSYKIIGMVLENEGIFKSGYESFGGDRISNEELNRIGKLIHKTKGYVGALMLEKIK
ncbi:hypothetical protein TUBRATIS_29100 [Tubulinosema ratisbonensis]|uniref:Uncharacterized protein n=1 Tax=Tubulinosema ratisbonensis TaxID=291195 RepID=A0A437AHP6_9MICR|nr:hypothetical protein TUBRATIS_29100 [Tubulinosema ratisbonensis]